jgi:hypothetical protein
MTLNCRYPPFTIPHDLSGEISSSEDPIVYPSLESTDIKVKVIKPRNTSSSNCNYTYFFDKERRSKITKDAKEYSKILNQSLHGVMEDPYGTK